MLRPRRVALAPLLFAFACTPEPGEGPTGGADAGIRGDGGLPTVAEVLPASRYDCTATGPFQAPPRAHPVTCWRERGCRARLLTAHRFANPFGPENGLSALRAAILLGVDLVETDVRTTRDGHVVLMHDSTIDRTTTGRGEVEAIDLAELRALRLISDPRRPGDFSCEQVPTLEEVFALSRGQVTVMLEVKDTEAGVATARFLRDQGLYQDAFLLCDPGECAAARAAVPDVPIMSRPRRVDEVDAQLAYDPPPLIVHGDPTDAFFDPAVIAKIHGVGAKFFVDAFTTGDIPAALSQDLTGYLRPYERGADIVQVEQPHWALLALDRL